MLEGGGKRTTSLTGKSSLLGGGAFAASLQLTASRELKRQRTDSELAFRCMAKVFLARFRECCRLPPPPLKLPTSKPGSAALLPPRARPWETNTQHSMPARPRRHTAGVELLPSTTGVSTKTANAIRERRGSVL
mmetsp:Transcript_55309/g.109650  ORF Transcript_55309/g.109650 Transcript_55309/m.109650 type:complete len:134 (+) Transcript_55309:259-660(+)